LFFYLTIDVTIRCHRDIERVHGSGASTTAKTTLVINVVLHCQLFSLENGSTASETRPVID
jgi:hypothetical protein